MLAIYLSLNSFADSILPSVNFLEIIFLSLHSLTVTRLFGFVLATTLGRFLIVLIFSGLVYVKYLHPLPLLQTSLSLL